MTTLSACPVCGTPRPSERAGNQPWCCSLACYHTFHGTAVPAADGVTITCPVCQRSFRPTSRQRFCSEACRVADYRRRRDTARPPATAPTARPRPPVTVHQCDSCGARTIGDHRCAHCATVMRTIGLGGQCPCCGEPVAVTELLAQEVVATD